METLRAALFVIGISLALYYAIYNLTFLIIIARAAVDIAREARWPKQVALAEIFANPQTPGVSIIVPAHNEAVSILPAVDALRSLRYPLVRIVIVDDGSTDDTFELLRDHLRLIRIPLHLADTPSNAGLILSTWRTPGGDITVVRKQSTGRRSDAVNAGLRFADQELVCMIDADSLLEADALLHVAEPFLLDESVVGVGGIVRPANGATIDRDTITEIRAPRRWVERIQALEYLRAFLVGRTGWSSINGLMIISGAFGVFRRTAITAVGGLDTGSLAEDADLVLAVHKHYRDQKIPARIAFVPTPVCWTEVPSTLASLARQRSRWSQGLGELLHKYRTMIANPRYGVLGVLTMPYFLLFEFLGPIIGGIGFAAMLVGAVTGITPWSLFWLTVAASVGLGFINSTFTVILEEAAYHRFARTSDALKILSAGLIEPLWFHALHAWWRALGVFRALGRRQSEWGSQQRTGFHQKSTN